MKKKSPVMGMSFTLFLAAFMALTGCEKSFNLPASPDHSAGSGPSSTPSLTASPASSTPTPSPSNPAGGTNTPTVSPTSTPTIVLFTATASATSTLTPQATPTPTSSPQATATPTSSATPSGTPILTATGTPTWTFTNSPQATATSTSPALATSTPTLSSTPTAASTATNTITPLLNTPSFTPTATSGTSAWVEAVASAPMTDRMFAGNVVYDNKMWIIAGGSTCAKAGLWKSDVWSSANGKTWTRATASAAFGIRYAMGAVVFNNQMFVIGGYDTSKGFVSDVWTSTNGSTWTELLAAAPFTPRFLFGCLVYNNQIWVIGGDDNDGVSPLADVWSSPDGVNWTQAGTLPAPRSGASCVVFNGSMMVIGGGNGNGAFNDVLTSTDGANWTELNPNAAFPPRSYAAAQNVNGTLWLMGGADTSNFSAITACLDDAWSSTDGVNWTERNATLPFWPRFSQESFSFNNEFWVVEGAWFAVGTSQTWNGSTGGSFTVTNEAFYPVDMWHTP